MSASLLPKVVLFLLHDWDTTNAQWDTIDL
jgi:hypothetical protein